MVIVKEHIVGRPCVKAGAAVTLWEPITLSRLLTWCFPLCKGSSS
jgi:hypothetical protein